ncbi:type 2 isopentenyl-diphosphate Delta-isomerase [Viridibacterium curvum]|uniref:Isopentenyl-diphosphate delta-isomerase n=2 Tax=Viridibacterium curvum TaxID=1101404 RepID=A0ABP9Q724_9RHOO
MSRYEAFVARKREHILRALDDACQATGLSGLDDFELEHEALPDIDLDEVTLASRLLGQPAPTPFYVAGMTAGHPDAAKINRLLARACERRGWAMGVGSQRRQLSATRADAELDQWAQLRAEAPALVLFGNIGLSQIIGTPIHYLQDLVTSIRAQALAVHLNPLQECMQPEGTPQFRGGRAALQALCAELGVPVVLKETGCGFSARTLRSLEGIGLAAVDVSGLGGTHWGRIEGARAANTPGAGMQAQAAETFRNWGVSTAQSVIHARSTLPRVECWASGGVRSGLDAAKLIALGAERVGYARPALEAALAGEEVLDRWMAQQEHELRIALFCSGCIDPASLRLRHAAMMANTYFTWRRHSRERGNPEGFCFSKSGSLAGMTQGTRLRQARGFPRSRE